MVTMRAKMKIHTVTKTEYGEEVAMGAVCKPEGYPEDGSDENNTYAKFTPQGDLSLTIANEALFGKLLPGQEFYIDFTLADQAG
jgi:hypothetical protein